MIKYVNFTDAYNHIGIGNNLTEEELRNLEAVVHVCDPHLFKDKILNSGLKSDEIVPLLKSITMSMNESILLCKWRNIFMDCSGLFTDIITEEGFCYTFNILNSQELFKEDV